MKRFLQLVIYGGGLVYLWSLYPRQMILPGQVMAAVVVTGATVSFLLLALHYSWPFIEQLSSKLNNPNSPGEVRWWHYFLGVGTFLVFNGLLSAGLGDAVYRFGWRNETAVVVLTTLVLGPGYILLTHKTQAKRKAYFWGYGGGILAVMAFGLLMH